MGTGMRTRLAHPCILTRRACCCWCCGVVLLLLQVRLHTDKATGKSKGYAHVHFADEAGLDRWEGGAQRHRGCVQAGASRLWHKHCRQPCKAAVCIAGLCQHLSQQCQQRDIGG